MIDHLAGRPNPSWKRAQVFLVILFWVWQIRRGSPGGPRVLWLRKVNRTLERYTPWQIIISTLTGVYAVRNLDKILGLGAPEPLAQLYSPSYYRATWITTGLDAGFATAMTIRPRWLRDICSVLFSVYYIIYASEADEKLRKYRAVPTVEMLRATWEKTTNPYIRLFTHYPKISVRRKFTLPRPTDSAFRRPITVWLFFAPPEQHLANANDLILDFPGGGFISMTPEHHEDRLRMWAVRTGKPVLSIDYGKAPEYPYPFAIDECFDTYRVLVESGGRLIGMNEANSKLNVIFSGDSAGAHVAVGVMMKILETQHPLPSPIALVLNYAALDFNFTSWMSPANLRVLRSEQSTGQIDELVEQKDHLGRISPLSMVGKRKTIRRRRSWRDTIRNLTTPKHDAPHFISRGRTSPLLGGSSGDVGSTDEVTDTEDESELPSIDNTREEDLPLSARVKFNSQIHLASLERHHHSSAHMNGHVKRTGSPSGNGQANGNGNSHNAAKDSIPLGTRLTMTSRTGYFQDRIISPSMMRAMAILYIGPHRNPEFDTDYHLSPILAPSSLLAQFPPLLMSCGEKDPFVDDTVIFAGRVREAKRARRTALDNALAGKGQPPPKPGGPLRLNISFEEMRRERDMLYAETEEDWVTMQIFSDWSHGYIQMSPLMPEARVVINDMADWMDETFLKRRYPRKAAKVEVRQASRPTSRPRLVVDDTSSAASGTDTETETVITFSPRKHTPPLPNGDHTHLDPHDLPPSPLESPTTPLASRRMPSRRRSDSRGREDSPARVRRFPWAEMRDDESSADEREPQSAVRLYGNGIAHGSSSGSPRRSSKSPAGSGTPSHRAGKEGQTISETELMRRRRLLDSHLIQLDGAK